jgi:flagellar protein FlgJ
MTMASVPAVRGIADLQGTLAIDAQALGALRAQAKHSPDAALEKVATQFEALFMQMMLKSMRESVPQEGMFDSDATRTYMSMLDQQLATSLAGRSGLGLAAVLVKQLRGLGGAGGALQGGQQAGAQPGSQPVESAAGVHSPLNPSVSPPVNPPMNRPVNPSVNLSVNPFNPVEGYALQEVPSPLRESVAPTPVPAQIPAHVREFIDKIGAQALAASRETGVPARFIAAQAALESNWGRNEIRGADGAPSHNLFGIKATRGWSGKTADAVTTEYANGTAARTTEKFRAYDSYSEAFLDYARLLRTRYKDAVAAGNDAAGFAQGLQRAGYATDPRYAEKVARIIQTSFSARA